MMVRAGRGSLLIRGTGLGWEGYLGTVSLAVSGRIHVEEM